MNLPHQYFQCLKGRWSFVRAVNGAESMRGSAQFYPLEDKIPTYAYREKGEYLLEALAHLSFFKDYIYCLRENTLEVYSACKAKKQHLLHTLDFSSSSHSHSIHHCGQDTYKATYIFLPNNTFALTYEIKGPRKDFTIKTFFSKVELPLGSVVG